MQQASCRAPHESQWDPSRTGISGSTKSREEATAEISDYINTFYNQTRRHSYLGGVSPEAFEAAAKQRRAVH